MKTKKKRHPRLLALFKAIVAYKMTHGSDGRPNAHYQFCNTFIWWAASDSFIWCKDAWVITIQEWPEFSAFRPYWSKDKLTRLWKTRLSHASKAQIIKEAIKALRKENKIVTATRSWKRPVFKRGKHVGDKTETHWVYHWADTPLSALAAL